jgi:hypothetical protein
MWIVSTWIGITLILNIEHSDWGNPLLVAWLLLGGFSLLAQLTRFVGHSLFGVELWSTPAVDVPYKDIKFAPKRKDD